MRTIALLICVCVSQIIPLTNTMAAVYPWEDPTQFDDSPRYKSESYDSEKIRDHPVPGPNNRIDNRGRMSATTNYRLGEMEQGFCVTASDSDQNTGVTRLSSINVNTAELWEDCKQKCILAFSVITGCEAIWNQGNRGCYVHTNPVDHGNGAARHKCWIAEENYVATPCSDDEMSILKITIHTDFYGRDTKWVLQDSMQRKLTGGPYGPNRQYSFDTCIMDICHTFTITDSGSDGMCCDFGRGFYQVEWDGELIKMGGKFTGSETVRFGSGCEELTYHPTMEPVPERNHYCPIKKNLESSVPKDVVYFEMDLALAGSDVDNANAESYILDKLKCYATEFCGEVDLKFATVEIKKKQCYSGKAKGSYKAPPQLMLGLIDWRKNTTHKKKTKRVNSLLLYLTFYPEGIRVSDKKIG